MGVLKKWKWAIAVLVVVAVVPMVGTASEIAAIQKTAKCTEAMKALVTALDSHTAARDAGEDINDSEVRNAEQAMEAACSNP